MRRRQIRFHRRQHVGRVPSISCVKNGVGFSQAVVEPHNELAIVFGGRLLFILRPAGKYHQSSSEAHVHDIIKGEAVRYHLAKGTPRLPCGFGFDDTIAHAFVEADS